jgi:hypothetical protein
LSEEREKNSALKQQVLQMDCELNMMESRISPKKTAAEYSKRSILPDLEQRA